MLLSVLLAGLRQLLQAAEGQHLSSGPCPRPLGCKRSLPAARVLAWPEKSDAPAYHRIPILGSRQRERQLGQVGNLRAVAVRKVMGSFQEAPSHAPNYNIGGAGRGAQGAVRAEGGVEPATNTGVNAGMEMSHFRCCCPAIRSVQIAPRFRQRRPHGSQPVNDFGAAFAILQEHRDRAMERPGTSCLPPEVARLMQRAESAITVL